MHPHIHAHTKWTCRICRSVYWLLYLWRRCAFWKRCFCSPLFYGDFTFSISSKQHFFLPYPFYLPNARMQTRRIKAGELRYLRSLTQSDLFKHSTIHFHCFQPHSLNARMLFISFERDALLSLFSSLWLARYQLSFCTIFESLFQHSCKRFHIIHFFFSAAYCGKQCFIQVNATRWNKSYTLRKWVRMSVCEREKTAHGCIHQRISIKSRHMFYLVCKLNTKTSNNSFYHFSNS